MNASHKNQFNYPLFFLLALLALALLPFIGSQSLHFKSVFTSMDSLDAEIFWSVRLPRVLFAFAVGAGLGLTGAVFQALLRNDLATPYTLGVSAGGAFGAVLAIKLNLVVSLFLFSSVSLISVLGSLAAMLVIYLLSRNRGFLSVYTLILAGVAISYFFSAFNLVLQYLSDFTETIRMIRWLMGGLDATGWRYPLLILLTDVLAFIYFLINAPAFDILLGGDEQAMSKGVDVPRLQKQSFIFSSILIGLIVAVAGPIGFVGLVTPHVLRLLLGPGHRRLFPAAFVGGGVFLAACDTIARTLISPAELPVGVITALIGGPFFIYLLLRHKQKLS